MSLKERKLRNIENQVRKTYQMECESTGMRRHGYRARRWAEMLYHEVLRDDVAIRAQSLSYFTLFSIMPVMAGLFLMLNFFSQWGPVQNQFQSLLGQILQPIPDDYRETLMSFILEFKDDYLAKITTKSSSIGIFALGVLIWIMAKVFFNVEDMMNRVWLSSEDRPWFERIQNFIVCAVVLPLCMIVAISLPGLLSHFGGGRASFLLEQGLPMLLEFFGMSFLFKYFPNVRVRWKSAFYGAGFSAFLLVFANVFLKIYFKFGTETAYGKAAVLPIVAFFVYVFWMIFILGAEVSFLIQNRSLFLGKRAPTTTLAEAALLQDLLKLLNQQFTEAKTPMTADELAEHFGMPLKSVQKVIRFLQKHQIVAEALPKKKSGASAYVLVRSVETFNLGKLIKDYLDIDLIAQNFDVFATISAIQPK